LTSEWCSSNAPKKTPQQNFSGFCLLKKRCGVKEGGSLAIIVFFFRQVFYGNNSPFFNENNDDFVGGD